MLDVTDRLIVIVGGGGVAIRKARGVIDAGATRVRMVALEFREGVPAGVERVTGAFEGRHLEGAGLVFAATDSAVVNDAVVREARRRGVWVNRADVDEDEPGDFTTPAVLRDGGVTVTVSAGGAPALAALVRDELAKWVDPRWGLLAEAMKVIRPRVLAVGSLDAGGRKAVFGELATEAALAVVASGGAEGLWEWIGRRYFQLRD